MIIYRVNSTHFDNLVPTTRNDDRVKNVGTESYAGHPLGVTFILDVVFALSEGVPELDGAVARAGYDLTVIGAEANGEDIGGVTNEATGGQSGVKIPETKGVIPGRRECELTVG